MSSTNKCQRLAFFSTPPRMTSGSRFAVAFALPAALRSRIYEVTSATVMRLTAMLPNRSIDQQPTLAFSLDAALGKMRKPVFQEALRSIAEGETGRSRAFWPRLYPLSRAR